MRLLARREHAQRELRTKLATRGFDAPEIDETLKDLEKRGWQSDERYAQSTLNARVGRGQGPRRIGQHLKQHGVSADVLARCDVDWEKKALQVLCKYLSNKDSAVFEVRMKALRHAVLKGFTPEQARKALERYQQESNE